MFHPLPSRPASIRRLFPRATFLSIALILLMFCVRDAAAQTPVITNLPNSIVTLYSFSGTDGANPYTGSGLVQDASGNLYGTTLNGGAGSDGAIFSVTTSGTLVSLISFSGTNGANPYAGLTSATDGNLYGTTYYGGANNDGAVYQLTPAGALNLIGSFDSTNGKWPRGALIQAMNGTLYGVTENGGENLNGAIYSVAATNSPGTLTKIISFNDSVNGEFPHFAMIQANDGNLYGCAFNGGTDGDGTVYQYAFTSGSLSAIYPFTDGADGKGPRGLVQGTDNNLYGLASEGGTAGDGTIFTVTTSGSFNTLHTFTGPDGSSPGSALIQATDGNFYGVTSSGGSAGLGVAFEVSSSGSFNTLCSFTGTSTGMGANPYGTLLQGADNNYYGTTVNGGANNDGTVFCLTRSATAAQASAFSYQILASNSPTGFNATGLPAGLSVDNIAGLISGTATQSGTFSVLLSASNASGTTTAPLALTVSAEPIPAVSTGTVSGTGDFAFQYQISASNNPTAYAASGLPAGLSVDPSAGLISGTPTVDGSFSATISAINLGGTGSATLTILLAQPPQPVISSTLSATGTASLGFSYPIIASNNPTSYTANSLPTGLDFDSSTGLISGTPTQTGTYSVPIQASNLGGTDNETLIIVVQPAPPVINSALSATGSSGVDAPEFLYQISATNTTVSSYDAATLPPGLTVNSSTGLISGTPASTGTFTFDISAANASGTGTESFTLTVVEALPFISAPASATGTNGYPFIETITSDNGPITFTATNLPPGLDIDPNLGTISGTPTQTGTFGVSIIGVNITGTSTASTRILILPPPPQITSTAVTGSNGIPFSFQIAATNSPTAYALTGTVPGLGFNTGSGILSGTPSVTGTFSLDVSASNAGGTGTSPFTVTILPHPPTITSVQTSIATTGSAYSYQITAVGNPVSYGASGLPPGLTVSSSSGIISGSPSTNGTFDATMTASNALGETGSAPLLVIINPNFPSLQGAYAGLGSVFGADTAGFTLTLTAKGGFTGKLTIPGAQYPLSGSFLTDGLFNGATSGKTTSVLQIDSAVPSVSGTVTLTTTSGITYYSVEATRLGKFTASTIPSGIEGRYTVILPAVSGSSPDLPHAPGFATMTVGATGQVKLTGTLGDGSAFTTSSQLHVDGKGWTLFDILYPGAHPGSIAGEITFENLTSSDADGAVDWIKPAQTSASLLYRDGFDASTNLFAATYKAPPLASGTALLTLSGGALVNSATDALSISATSKVTVTGTNDLTLSLTPGTGTFHGSFHFPVTGKATPVNGVIYQKSNPDGYGLFISGSETGAVEISQ